jgi:hypothetical protein
MHIMIQSNMMQSDQHTVAEENRGQRTKDRVMPGTDPTLMIWLPIHATTPDATHTASAPTTNTPGRCTKCCTGVACLRIPPP